MPQIIKTNELPVITDLTNAKIIGLDKNGVDAQFKISDIKGDFKGQAVPATVPATPILAQYYNFSQPGTYTNFLSAPSTPVVIANPAAGQAIIDGKLTFTGTYWVASYQVATLPIQDLTAVNAAISQNTTGLVTANLAIGTKANKGEGVGYTNTSVTVNSNNILNPGTQTADVYIDSGGNAIAASTPGVYFTSDFLPWSSSTAMVAGKNGVAATQLFTVAQYDTNKIFITGSFQGTGNIAPNITKATGAVYIRFTAAVANVNQVNRGTTILAYTAYSETINSRVATKDANSVPTTFKPDTTDAALVSGFSSKSQGVGYTTGYTTDTTNKLNPAAVIPDYYLSSSGALTAAGDLGVYATTPFIPWDTFTQIILGLNGVIASQSFDFCQYNASQVFIAGSWSTIPGTALINKYAGAAYVRITYELPKVNQINMGGSILPYRTYLQQVPFKTGNADAAGVIATFKPDVNDTDLNAKFSTVAKTAQTLVTPNKIYTLCNDLDKSDNGFNSHNYAAVLYTDHFIKLTAKKKAIFASTLSDKLPLFAPVDILNATYNGGVSILSTTVNDTITGDIIDAPFSIVNTSVLLSASGVKFPKILCIGDSVTQITGAAYPSYATTNNPAQYWSWMRKMNLMYRAQNPANFNYLTLGRFSKRTFTHNSTSYTAYAEGRGGWAASNYLFDQTGPTNYSNYFYDAAQAGTNKFSLAYYLAQNKTLADDGITRLIVGGTAGTAVTDATAWDVCTPTHVIIQLGFNDTEADYKTNVPLMIARIKSEFPNMVVIVSIIDQAGTYYPELYPSVDYASTFMGFGQLHDKMYNLASFAKGLEDSTSRVYFAPCYFIQPTALGVTTREVNYPEYIADPKFIMGKGHGGGYTYHPNTFAHASWAYQLDALVKYTSVLHNI
jgi:hypothetical protein